jgi:hypothetical protein
MKCSEVHERIADLFEKEISREIRDEFSAHFRECAECRKLYEEVSQTVAGLKPHVTVDAGNGLHERIMGSVIGDVSEKENRGSQPVRRIKPVWKKVIAIAAVIAALFLIIPILNFFSRTDVKAATVILQKSIDALGNVRSFYMEYEVRTRPGDNFEYINRDDGYVLHKLWKIAGSPGKWRIEKPGRTVVMDGKHQYLYMDGPGSMALMAGPDAGFVEWMRILLDPAGILEKERLNSMENGSKFRIEENGDLITLTINAKATGNYTNAYLLNTSIPESNNSRVYTFDKATRLLKSLDIYIDSAGNSVRIFEVKDIKYNIPVEDAVFNIPLPGDLKWVPVNELAKQTGVAGITSEDAARRFFTACHNEDWATVRQLIPGFINFVQLQFAVKAEYGGLTIISIGKPFKSGRYPGEFIPYEIRKKNGYVKKWNLAVRNDNPEKKWVIDGGF